MVEGILGGENPKNKAMGVRKSQVVSGCSYMKYKGRAEVVDVTVDRGAPTLGWSQ